MLLSLNALRIMGAFIPSTINKENPVFFGIDNADLTIDTPDGKGYGTGTVV